MSKFRRKPVVIEAYPNHPGIWDDENSDHPEWLQEAIDKGNVFLRDGKTIIYTLEGEHLAGEGDMIIQGVKGELYPCKPDIFATLYDLVEDDTPKEKPHD